MEAGWFAHVTVTPDAVIFVKLVICGGTAVDVVVVPEEVFVVEVLVPDEVVVVVDELVGGGGGGGVVVGGGATVRVTGITALPPFTTMIVTVPL